VEERGNKESILGGIEMKVISVRPVNFGEGGLKETSQLKKKLGGQFRNWKRTPILGKDRKHCPEMLRRKVKEKVYGR